MYVIYTLGGSGGMVPQEILVFILSETAPGASSRTVSLVFIKQFREKLFSTGVVETGIERPTVATSRGWARFDQGGGASSPPAPSLNETQVIHGLAFPM